MSTDEAAPSPARRWLANELFYPAASLYGAAVLAWSVLAMAGLIRAPASLATPVGHAHELLLGFALAVVAGNQLPAMLPRRLLLLFGLWALARAASLALPPSVALPFDAAFAAALAWQVAPRLLRAAKKLRNQALPAIVIALAASVVAFDVARLPVPLDPHAIATAVVLLFAALMLFMGGRIIAPGVAGQLYRQGESLAARVQPRIEGALLIAMATAIVAAVLAQELTMRAGCAIAGVLAIVRLLRWRLWACERRPDLLCLGAGYGWIGIGLLAIAASAPGGERMAALHVITVGALGTLTFNVMATTAFLRARRIAATERSLVAGTALIAAATIARVVAAFAPGMELALLVVAAGFWSAAFLLLFAVLASARRTQARWASEQQARAGHEP